MDLIIAVALLCQTSISSGDSLYSKNSKTIQQECQKYYIQCYENLVKIKNDFEQADILVQCIKDKK